MASERGFRGFSVVFPGGRGARIAALLLLLAIIVPLAVLGGDLARRTENAICSLCHPGVGGELAGTPHQGFSCSRCHRGAVGFVVSGILAELGLIPSGAVEVHLFSPCLTCHTPEALRGMRIHAVHFSVVSATRTCNSCHRGHDLGVKADYCTECHSLASVRASHADFHRMALEEYRRGRVICARCHSATALWVVPIPASAYNAVVREGVGCFTCHRSLRMVTNVENCLRCHAQ